MLNNKLINKYTGKIHVFACPKSNRALKFHEEHVLGAMSTALAVVNGKVAITEERHKEAFKIGSKLIFVPPNAKVQNGEDLEYLDKILYLIIERSPSLNNEIVLLFSRWPCDSVYELEQTLKLSMPVHLV